MLKHILPLVPEHTLYTESFVGGAALLFAKEPAEVEVINDLNSELVNFYWVASVHYHDLKEEIDKTLHARGIHEHADYIYNHPDFFQPVHRAWAVWVLCKLSFANKINGPFGFAKTKNSVTKKITNAKDAFTEKLCDRLSKVTIEKSNAIKVIQRFDVEHAFHFVDPPYINSNCGHYEGMFNHEDLIMLLKALTRVKGKFMLTMYPHEEIDCYASKHSWRIVEIERTITASRTTRKKKKEWIVMNY